MKYDLEVARAVAHWRRVLGVPLEPALVHAIIEQETSHGPKMEALEPDGDVSYGPMMVKRATAVTVLHLQTPEMLKVPRLGIWFGTKYLGQMLARFRGDTLRAVAAYNAGPGNARRGTSGRFPNQPYVDRVVEFWNRYKSPALALAPAAVAVVLGILVLSSARRRRAA